MLTYHYITITEDTQKVCGAHLADMTVTLVTPKGATRTVATVRIAEPMWNTNQADALNKLTAYIRAGNPSPATPPSPSAPDLLTGLPSGSRTVVETLDLLASLAATAPLVTSPADLIHLELFISKYAPGYGHETPIPLWVTPTSAKCTVGDINILGISSHQAPCKELWQAATLATIAWKPNPRTGVPSFPDLAGITPAQAVDRTVRFFTGQLNQDRPTWKCLNPAPDTPVLRDRRVTIDAIPDGSTVYLHTPFPIWLNLPEWAANHNIRFVDTPDTADWTLVRRESHTTHNSRVATHPARPVRTTLRATPEYPQPEPVSTPEPGNTTILNQDEYQKTLQAVTNTARIQHLTRPAKSLTEPPPWLVTKYAWQTPETRIKAMFSTIAAGVGAILLVASVLGMIVGFIHIADLTSPFAQFIRDYGPNVQDTKTAENLLHASFASAVVALLGFLLAGGSGGSVFDKLWFPGMLPGAGTVRFCDRRTPSFWDRPKPKQLNVIPIKSAHQPDRHPRCPQ